MHNFWQELETSWLILDAELMPWSHTAQGLLESQYAAVGASASHSLKAVHEVINKAKARGLEMDVLHNQANVRLGMVDNYIEAYRRYCWPVNSLSDIKLAPFHLLATEGKVHGDKSHLWHMETLQRYLLSPEASSIQATSYRHIDLTDEASCYAAIAWWEVLTAAGGEGIVVKPLDFISQGKHGVVQPAIKVRGREYLRIIYGPEYDLPQNLERLRERWLRAKYSLVIKEFALGMEGLERLITHAPLRQIHQCVFAVLALESKAVDPRL
ncbi:MAG: hypothetical protein R2865_01000 [Deinococcales bacterium]